MVFILSCVLLLFRDNQCLVRDCTVAAVSAWCLIKCAIEIGVNNMVWCHIAVHHALHPIHTHAYTHTQVGVVLQTRKRNNKRSQNWSYIYTQLWIVGYYVFISGVILKYAILAKQTNFIWSIESSGKLLAKADRYFFKYIMFYYYAIYNQHTPVLNPHNVITILIFTYEIIYIHDLLLHGIT